MEKNNLTISEPKKFEVIYELTKDIDGFNVKGRQYGKKGTILWTPDGKEGREVNADQEAIEIALRTGYFKQLPAQKNRRKG